MVDPTEQRGPSALLADFAAGLRYEALPHDVVEQSKNSILDVLGIALAGAGIGEGCDEIVAYAMTGGAGPATLWATGQALSPSMAALANAAHARALDYDDIIEYPQIHVAVCVVPAVLAAAQSMPAAVTGKAVLAAVVAGVEVQARLAAALAPHFGTGLPVMLASQTFGYFSAAAACGNLLGLDPAAMLSALGLAQMQAAGTEEMVVHAAASVGKCLYAGFSNQGGLQSAAMAACGVVARGEPLAGKAGLFNAFFSGAYASDALTRDLGVDYVSLRRCFKAMPGTLVSHAFSEAALTLMRSHELSPASIAQVRLHVGPWGQVMSEPHAMRRAPPSASAAMNSIPFIVAKTLVHGRVALDDFTSAGRADAATLAMAARIEHVVDPALANRAGLEPGIVEIVTTDKRVLRLRVDKPAGHPSRPLGLADVSEKFRLNTAHAQRPMTGGHVQQIVDQVRHFEHVDNVRHFLDLITHRAEHR